MEVDEIVCEGGLDVSLWEILPALGRHQFKCIEPTFTELLLVDEALTVFMDSYVDVEGGGVPTYAYFLFNLSHAPLELCALFEFEVGVYQLVEDLADGL